MDGWKNDFYELKWKYPAFKQLLFLKFHNGVENHRFLIEWTFCSSTIQKNISRYGLSKSFILW